MSFCPPAKYWTIEEKCIPCVSPDAIRKRASLEINHYHIVYVGEKWYRQRDLNSRASDYKAIVFSMSFSEEIQNFHSNTDGLDFNLVAQEPDNEEGRTTQTLSDFSIRSTQERCPHIYFWATIYSLGDP